MSCWAVVLSLSVFLCVVCCGYYLRLFLLLSFSCYSIQRQSALNKSHVKDLKGDKERVELREPQNMYVHNQQQQHTHKYKECKVKGEPSRWKIWSVDDGKTVHYDEINLNMKIKIIVQMNEWNAFDSVVCYEQNRPFNLYKLLADIITMKLLKFWWNLNFIKWNTVDMYGMRCIGR